MTEHSRIRSTFRRDWTKAHNDNLVDCINAYWKVNVCTANTIGTRHSHMRYGVPEIASNQNYKHADIIYVRKFGDKWSIVK